MKIDDAIVEVDAVDCMGHGYIEVYKMDAHNKAQKADDMLGGDFSGCEHTRHCRQSHEF